MTLPQPPLLLITDRHQAAQPLTDIVEAALEAGCRWVSVREKDLAEGAMAELLANLGQLAGQYGARLGLHAEAQQALHFGLNAVHLPSGADAAAARRLLGKEALIGISVHSTIEIACLDPGLVDYAILGPAFPTESKPGYGPALGLDGIRAAAHASSVPLIAIGGIGPDNATAVIAAGAAGIAVMGGIMRAADPGRAMNDLLQVMA